MSLIRFLHGSADLGDIAVFVGGMPVTRQLAYGESTPHFLMDSGQTMIRVEEKGELKLQNHVIVPKDQAFTLLFTSRSGVLTMIPIAEEGQAAPEGMSGMRVAGFAENEQTLELWRRGVEEQELLFSEISQGDVSEYVHLEVGSHGLEIQEDGAIICMLPGQELEEGQLYTAYMIGRGDPDEEERPLSLRLLRDFKNTNA